MSTDANIANFMGLARTALLAGNNEEALTYFNRVLEIDPSISEAWAGKAKAAGWQSTLVNIRLNETILAFSHAIATASDDQKVASTSDAIDETNKITVAVYGLARRQLDEYVALDNTWVQYLAQVSQLLDALDQIRAWDPANRVTLENIVHLCKDNIEGVSYRDRFDNNTPKAWHLSPEYEKMVKARLDAAVNDLRTLDPSYAPPAIEKKQAENCFVVTATMGDANHPTVNLMRTFRDQWLARTVPGQRLIRWYYDYGPSVAAFIEKSSTRRTISYVAVVRPAAALASFLMNRR